MLKGLKQTAVVKPGGLIEVQSDALPVGSTVDVIVLINHQAVSPRPSHPLDGLSKDEQIAKIRAVLGGWKDDPEIAEIFSDIDRERHTYQGRAIATFED